MIGASPSVGQERFENCADQSPAINEYGDRLIHTTGTHGPDISSQRRDDLDAAAVAQAASLGSEGRCADFGCGLGHVGLAFADAGGAVDFYDIAPCPPAVREVMARDPDRVRYHQIDLRALRSADLPPRLNLCLSQRTLHYLRNREAITFLATVHQNMVSGARFFISASGLGSELGQAYPATATPIDSRFARLAAPMRKKHGIHEPVCLYTRAELVALMSEAGFTEERSWVSDFGNIKGIFVQH